MSQEITIKKSTYDKILVGLFVLAVGFSFTAGYIFGGSGTATGQVVREQVKAPTVAAPTDDTLPAEPGRVQVSADNDPAVGSSDAPLTVIEFSDFQCPFCGRFYSDTEVQLRSNYVDSGKVKFIYRDFPLDSIHPQAAPAALAAECSNEQGKFWEYHDKLFQNQGSLSDANYKQWAADLGLDTAKFNSCYDAKKYASEIQADFQDGVDAGVSGTPTTFIGTPEKGYIKIVGAQPYNVIQQVIDQELAA